MCYALVSLTKVFTALLLADMVRKGEVALGDPVERYLPTLRMAEAGRGSVTLLDLATHTSGMPFMPDELPALDSPAADYDAARLYRFVASRRWPPGQAAWEYSNLGYWLLGEALAARAGTDYERLLSERVIAPLGLEGTALTLSPKLRARLAVGHNAVLGPAPSISTVPVFAVMAASGGLISTADDLLRLLSVAMGYRRSSLSPALADLLDTRRPASRAGVVQALGWVVIGQGDDALVVHDGGTLGYASSVAWDPRRRVGVVVLSNQMTDVGDLARHLLRPGIPLETPTATRRTEAAIDPALLEAYAGLYRAPEEGEFTLSRQGSFLTIQLPASWGLPRLRLRPESARDFFVAELPLRVTLQTNRDGRVTGMLVYPPRGQEAIAATRIDADR